jgi:RNA polymerase sigma factor (sigma-70 family)
VQRGGPRGKSEFVMKTPSAAWSSRELLTQTDWVRALARRLVDDAAQADDLVQETLLAALEGRPSAAGSLRPWLAAVLRRRLAFWRRGQARRQQRELARASAETVPSSAELIERAETQGVVVQAIAALREPYRTVLLLRFYEGLQPREIARRRGVPAATVRSQLSRGLEELGRELDGSFGGERRRWALALVPLALEASRRASSPLTIAGLVCAVVVLIVAGTWGLTRGGAVSVASGEAPVLAALDEVRDADALADPGEPSTEKATPVPAVRAPVAGTSGSSGSQELQAPVAPVSGVLRELRGTAPIPYFALEVRDAEGVTELVWSDGEGQFRGTREYAAGTLMVTQVDHPEMDGLLRYAGSVLQVGQGLTVSQSFDPEHGPYEWKATTGPTYPLELTAPFHWDSRELKASLQATQQFEPPYWVVQAPVRRPDGPWVRFQPLYGSLPSDRPWQLAIETDDGLWGGEALVQPGEGRYPEPVAIELVARACLEVELLSAGPLRGPVVTLESVADGTRRALFGTGKHTLEDGRTGYEFELTALPPGGQRVLVRAGGEEYLATQVQLEAGQRTRRVLEVGASLDVAHVRGELRSLSGTLREPVNVQLFGRGSTWSEDPEWIESNGAWVAPFAFENLPVGEYVVQLVPQASYRRWEPAALRVSPPTDDLVITCDDVAPARELLLRIHTPDSGSFGAVVGLVTVAGSPSPSTMTSAGGKTLRVYRHPAVPVDAAFTWFAWAEGHAPQWGDEEAQFVEDDQTVVEVTLERGWGGRVTALDVGGATLEGVAILLDGELAATTDAHGTTYLGTATRPTTVELQLDGYRFEQGDYDPVTARLTGKYGMHVLRFAREP